MRSAPCPTPSVVPESTAHGRASQQRTGQLMKLCPAGVLCVPSTCGGTATLQRPVTQIRGPNSGRRKRFCTGPPSRELNHPHMRMETQQQPGNPVEGLPATGERSEPMAPPSRGLSGFGSVSLAVLARARRPPVLVRAESPDDQGTRSSAGDVVVGLDLPEARQEVLGFAFAGAQRCGCGLRIVHSWSLPPAYGPGTTDVVPALMEEVATARQEEMTRAPGSWNEKYPAVPVSIECLQGIRRRTGRGLTPGQADRPGPPPPCLAPGRPCPAGRPLGTAPHGGAGGRCSARLTGGRRGRCAMNASSPCVRTASRRGRRGAALPIRA